MFSGAYPPIQLAAQILMYNVMSMVVLPILGLGATLTTYVGNSIGEGDIAKTKKYIRAGLLLTLAFVLVEAPSLFVFRKQISKLFTRDEDVIMSTVSLEVMYAIGLAADFLQQALMSILRGIGKERTGCAIFVTGYYVVGLPFGYYLGSIRKMYAPGVWIGILTAIGFNLVGILDCNPKSKLRFSSESDYD